MDKRVFAVAIIACSLMLVDNAKATLVGGPVPDTTFGGLTTYNYQESSVPAFTMGGGGTLQLTIATFGDTFGTSQNDQSSKSVIFSNEYNTAGDTQTISPGYSPFIFFFKTVGTNQLANCDPTNGSDCAATLFTNGSTAGAASGNDGGQTDLAIYYASTINTYAFFFDDGGEFGLSAGVPIDDNDYNDLVVTYTPSSVPEPMSLAVLGSSLLALGITRSVFRKLGRAE